MASVAEFAHMLTLFIALVLRMVYAIVFYIASFQIFFAGGMAVSGGLSAATSKSMLGSLWDRSEGLTKGVFKQAARGLLATLHPVMHHKFDTTMTSMSAFDSREHTELEILSQFWNKGLIRDLVPFNPPFD